MLWFRSRAEEVLLQEVLFLRTQVQDLQDELATVHEEHGKERQGLLDRLTDALNPAAAARHRGEPKPKPLHTTTLTKFPGYRPNLRPTEPTDTLTSTAPIE